MNHFKNSNGRYLLKNLFYENEQLDKQQAIYTLKDEDHLSYPSLYRLYMEELDPTEYTFATKHLDGWKHWMELSKSEFFVPYVTRWREEHQVRAKALALANVWSIADGNSPAKFAANKFIVDGGWQKPAARRVGRPEKEKIVEVAELLDSEKELLGIRIN